MRHDLAICCNAEKTKVRADDSCAECFSTAPVRRSRFLSVVMSVVSGLPLLLFRQRLILAVLAGSVALRDALLGGGFFLLVLMIPRNAGWRRTALLILFFFVGLGVTKFSSPEAPVCPSWASVPRKSVLVEADVESVTGLAGGRVRILLENMRPLKDVPSLPEGTKELVVKALERRVDVGLSGGRKGYPGLVVEDDVSPVPGLVSMTLYADDLTICGRPVAGQRMRALLRLYPCVGSVNPGTSDLGAYWADRDVWHNARVNRTRTGPVFLEFSEGEGGMFRASLLRERWRSELEAALESGGTKTGADRGGGLWSGESPLACSQGRAMLIALLFGDRSVLTPETVDLFTRAGLVHSLALSGQHLALAAMAGVAFVFLLSLLHRRLFLFVPRRVLVVSAGLPFALAYLFLGGAPFSLVRAACMMLAAAVFVCLRRSVAPLDALFAAALLLFLGWPNVVFDLSAQLSVLAVAGILLSLPLTSALRRRFPPARRPDRTWRNAPRRAVYAFIRWTGTMLLLSLSAQMAVLPVLISVFGVVSMNVWMNLVWLPPLTFITLPAAALGLLMLTVFGPQPVSDLFFTVAAWPADAMIDLLAVMDGADWLPFVQCFRPSSLTSLGYGALFVGFMLLAGAGVCGRDAGAATRRLLLAGMVLMPLGQMSVWLEDVHAREDGRVSLTMFDVGQGQAVLIEGPEGRVLVDGGGGASPFFDCGRSILAPALTYRRLPRLDAVLVSHTDMDHARGLRWILEHFEVGCLVWSSFSAADDSVDGRALREIARRRNIPEKILERGDVFSLTENVRLEVVWPDEAMMTSLRPGKKVSGNDASLAFRLMRDDRSLALLCGDMTSSSLNRLVKSGQDLRADILVLPHHGAASSFQRKFYDAVSPKAVLASAAAYNHYGFPSRKVREEMERRNIPLYSTTMLGGMTVTWIGQDAVMHLPEH